MPRKYLKTIIAFSLPLQVILVQVIATQPKLVEKWYSGTFYKQISQFLRTLFGNTTVPIGQLLFYSIIILCLIWLIRQFRAVITKKVNFKLFLKNILLGTFLFLATFYFLFMLTWGFNYHRQPVSSTVGIEEKRITPTKLVALCQVLVNLTNTSRNQLTPNNHHALSLPITHSEIITRATWGYQKMAQKYPALAYSHPAVKSVYVPELMSFFGVGGIYFPFTGEANVNMDPPDFLLPATVCHEMAHQIGIASEDEANYVAYLACRLNPDPSFEYSGNLMAMKYAMNRLHRVDSVAYQQLEQQFSPGLKLDLEKSRNYWNSFNNPIAQFSDVFYDLFLKANDQTEGIESYSRMVELIMGEYKKNKLLY